MQRLRRRVRESRGERERKQKKENLGMLRKINLESDTARKSPRKKKVKK